MNVIVTGATGFVGTYLVRELQQAGENVTVIVRDVNKVNELLQKNIWTSNIEVIQVLSNTFSDLSIDKFKYKSYDIWFHFAWDGTSGDKRADIQLQLFNVQSVCNSIEFASKISCKRFINAGSIMEYEALATTLTDGMHSGMGTIYSISKLTADMMGKTYAAKCNIEYVNIVISNIYGVGEKSERFLNTTIRKMLSNERIPLTAGTQLYDFIYVIDAVHAIILVSLKGKADEIYYIGNTKQKPLKEYIIEMKNILKSTSELAFGEIPLVSEGLTYSEFDTSKLEKFGFKPEISFSEGITRYVEWIKGE